MKKNGWMDLLGGLLGMQNASAPNPQPAPTATKGGWATAGQPLKTNQNYSLTKPNFDPIDYSQSAYVKLLKRHDAISKRIDLETGNLGARDSGAECPPAQTAETRPACKRGRPKKSGEAPVGPGAAQHSVRTGPTAPQNKTPVKASGTSGKSQARTGAKKSSGGTSPSAEAPSRNTRAASSARTRKSEVEA